MTIEPTFFPYITTGLAVICLLILVSGWHRGFLKTLVNLLFWVVSIFGGWIIASLLAGTLDGVSLGSLSPGSLQHLLVSRILVFFVSSILIRIAFIPVYALIGFLKKIKVIRLADHLGGLILSGFTAWIFLSLLTLFLQTGTIGNGRLYVENSPLSVVSESNDAFLETALKGEIDFNEIW